ncbi:hypothetical protein PHLGIDRAFT_298318 [Phlebiopsis gigantea 11061_1 CR5-6]|uniref:FHA domain-containing protein n=1 Tax=Phlebiopsis gigantea (strain 11061_1 CR5-6) TaxID=745531 RepID=A0A0C3PBM9_PHLG1|nr:hypothetical protein PHLGIDRAFT_298318 [Phlebiopsis gigantea 11061_1 CR5-6]
MASTMSTSRSSTMSDIAGISLIVDKHGDEPAHVLTFYKNKADVILIGRRSSTSARPPTDEHDRALFRCPVISRRHAKITFTQYGNAQVYISDLASHHGTHIQRPGETLPKPVPSEYPTVLADGDTLTFGKPVGKESSLVHPVTARVHLLFSIPSTSSPPAQASSTEHQLTSPAAVTTPSRTGSSGRYGIYTPAMTSSGSDSSSEDEIEEMPPPPPPQMLPPCSSFAGLPWGWPVASFQHHPLHQPQPIQHPHHMHRTDSVLPDSNWPGRLHLLRRILPRLGSVEEISSHRGSTRMSPISISSDSRSSSEVVEVSREDIARDATESTAGNTAEASHAPRAASPLEDAGEDMELESEAPSEYPSYKEWSFADITLDGEEANNDTGALLIAASSRICSAEPASPHSEESDDSSDMYATPAPPAFAEEDDVNNAEAVPEMPSLEGESALEAAPQAEAQFEARVESLKSKLAELEQRMFVPEQAVPDEAQRAAEPEPSVEIEPAPPVNDNDASVPEMMDMLKDMLQAFDALRKTAEADMAHELAAIRAAREEAEAAVTAARAAAARPTEAVTALESRKRKREEEHDDVDAAAAGCPALFDKLAAEPPRKRVRGGTAKRIAVGVAKTTAIAAVSAVATWSALAFS